MFLLDCLEKTSDFRDTIPLSALEKMYQDWHAKWYSEDYRGLDLYFFRSWMSYFFGVSETTGCPKATLIGWRRRGDASGCALNHVHITCRTPHVKVTCGTPRSRLPLTTKPVFHSVPSHRNAFLEKIEGMRLKTVSRLRALPCPATSY
jgi:hypothetical protein